MAVTSRAARAAIQLAALAMVATLAAPAWAEGMRGLLVMQGDRVLAEERPSSSSYRHRSRSSSSRLRRSTIPGTTIRSRP